MGNIKDTMRCEGVNWLSDFPVVTAKTNSGKTTFAVRELREFVERETGNPIDKVILLTPYKRTRKQILSDERFAGFVRELDYNFLKSSAFSNRVNEIIVTTYAALCLALKDEMLTLDGCLIVFDELHTFADFTAYQPQMGYLLEWLVNPDYWGKFYAVGLSGTPQILFDYVNRYEGLPFRFVDVTPESPVNITCGKGLFIRGGSAQSYADLLIQQGFTGAKLFYVDSAKVCYELAQKFNDAGYHAAYIVSEYHDKHADDNGVLLGESVRAQVFDGLSIVDWLDENSDVPATLNVLVVNASAKDGINILDESNRFDEAIIESTNRATVEQARSRIRHDLECLTVVYSRKNESQSRFDLADVLSFLERYDGVSGAERAEMLYKRLEEQRDDENLNWVAAKGRTAFLNPFIKSLCAYNLDNYEFSSCRTYYDDAGNEIEERRTISRFGRIMPSFAEWRDELKPLIGGADFETVSGAEIREIVNGTAKIQGAFASGMIECGTWYDKEQLREIAQSLNLKNANGDDMGYEYLVEQIGRSYNVEHKKNQIKKIRKWRYRFAERD